jgi:hypothetical protein
MHNSNQKARVSIFNCTEVKNTAEKNLGHREKTILAIDRERAWRSTLGSLISVRG